MIRGDLASDISSYPSSYPLPKMFRFVVDFRGALYRRSGAKRMGSQLKHSYAYGLQVTGLIGSM